ncbi:MAG TPA: MBL fold metallo-hydrolase, partial [Ruminiclostridium sp.]|nr:MBL fold metallo-hydrolase [Ruminiclostridium sp.]
MFVRPIYGGLFDSVSYLVGEKEEAILIDAGVPCGKVFDAAKELNTSIKKIILTHGHVDHIAEADNIIEKTSAVAYIHTDDKIALTDTTLNVSRFMGTQVTAKSNCKTLSDGDTLKLGDLEFKIIHTPGHTPGSICIQTGNLLFSGDTLFRLGYGNYELPNGNFSDIYNSIV